MREAESVSTVAYEKVCFTTLKKRFDELLKAVIEARCNWGMMCDLLEEVDIEAVVAHPLKTRTIADAKI